MNKSIKNVAKIGIVGGILYGVFEFADGLGQGRMLGTMLKYDASAKEVLDSLQNYNGDNLRYTRSRLIRLVALSILSGGRG